MNILEKADRYAEGKANAAITKAIAEAYAEGYKNGYNDREQEIPVNIRSNKTEYVDLGLPSGTLWALRHEMDEKGEYLYLPFCKARQLNLPTKKQFEELQSYCRWDYSEYFVKCIGPNGDYIRFYRTSNQTN